MSVRHNKLENEDLLTRYGTLKLGAGGVVLNMEEIGVTKQQLLNEPDLLDTDKFPPKAEPVEVAVKQVTLNPSKEEMEEKYKGVLSELLKSGAKLNGEGYIEMDLFMIALKDKGLKPITGAYRKELQDSLKNAG